MRDPINDSVIDRFLQGLQLQGETSLTLPAIITPVIESETEYKVESKAEREVLLTITEGRYHQVKRMFAAVGNRVQQLHRQQIGEVRLDVPVGEWRYLTSNEVVSFQCLNEG